MNILFATSRFEDFSGSEITVLEYAVELSRLGHQINIVCFSFSDFYKNQCQINNIGLFDFDNIPEQMSQWDLIWILHNPTYYALFSLYNFSAKKVIFSSLSHYEPLETPPVELVRIGAFTVHSKENRDFFIKQYPDYADRVLPLLNSSPSEYWDTIPSNTKANKIAIVSNHVPQELLELSLLLKEINVEVDIYGVGHIKKMITPEILKSYKACISIGKTVQYCLSLQIPIFCYDHFGGPGWINLSNIKLAEDFNFSGRCVSKKYSAKELISYFDEIKIPDASLMQKLYVYAKEKYDLKSNLNYILQNITENPSDSHANNNLTLKNILARNLIAFNREVGLKKEYLAAWNNEAIKRNSELLEVTELKDEILELRKQIEAPKKNFKHFLLNSIKQIQFLKK